MVEVVPWHILPSGVRRLAFTISRPGCNKMGWSVLFLTTMSSQTVTIWLPDKLLYGCQTILKFIWYQFYMAGSTQGHTGRLKLSCHLCCWTWSKCFNIIQYLTTLTWCCSSSMGYRGQMESFPVILLAVFVKPGQMGRSWTYWPKWFSEYRRWSS